MSSSYLSRFSSSNDNSPIRTLNTIYLSSPVTNTANSSNNNALSTSAKQVEAVTLLLKQTIAPAQLIQVKTRSDIIKEEGKKRNVYCVSFCLPKYAVLA